MALKKNTLAYGVIKALKSGPMRLDEIAAGINSNREFVKREIQRMRQAGFFKNWIVFIPEKEQWVFVKEIASLPINKIHWLMKEMLPKNFNPYMDLQGKTFKRYYNDNDFNKFLDERGI